MRLLILGGTGMLGHKLWQEASGTLEAWATIRYATMTPAASAVLNPDRVLTSIRAEEPETIAAALDTSDADVIVNCIGIIKQAPAVTNPTRAIQVNSLFPHQIADLCHKRNKRFIHISTDCVFSGSRGNYTEDDQPDATDLYGRSKLLGEATECGALTIRTSIIGRELASSYGLVEWLLSQEGKEIRGFTKAIFSGLTTRAFAKTLIAIITDHPTLNGLWHVSADPIDKNNLLNMLRDAHDIPVTVDPDHAIAVNRSLDSSRFRKTTGLQPPAWQDMIRELVADPTPYESIRRVAIAHR